VTPADVWLEGRTAEVFEPSIGHDNAPLRLRGIFVWTICSSVVLTRTPTSAALPATRGPRATSGTTSVCRRRGLGCVMRNERRDARLSDRRAIVEIMDVVRYGLLIWVSLKAVAYLWSTATLALDAGRFQRDIGNRHIPALANGIDRLFDQARPAALRRALLLAFNAPVVVMLGTVVCLIPGGSPWLVRDMGVATAFCSALALVISVLRRLVLGPQDHATSDVALPRAGPLKHWAVHDDGARGNLFVYFLVLVLMSVAGFAALYRGLALSDPHAFHADDVQVRAFTWVYFSLTTLGTVGFGDIHASSVLAQIAVACQIATGPLLVGWVLSVFTSSPPEPPAG
jgi:hypothetical protein